MSYRVHINNFQPFGNNEFPQEFKDFLLSSGVKIGKDGQFDHWFEVGEFDVMRALTSLETYVRAMSSEIESLWDFSYAMGNVNAGRICLNDALFNIVECGILFIPYNFIQNLLADGSIEFCGVMQDDRHLRCYQQIGRIRVQGC